MQALSKFFCQNKKCPDYGKRGRPKGPRRVPPRPRPAVKIHGNTVWDRVTAEIAGKRVSLPTARVEVRMGTRNQRFSSGDSCVAVGYGCEKCAKRDKKSRIFQVNLVKYGIERF